MIYCELCNKDLTNKKFADTYDGCNHICIKCFKTKREEWEKLKEEWYKIDYMYDDY